MLLKAGPIHSSCLGRRENI